MFAGEIGRVIAALRIRVGFRLTPSGRAVVSPALSESPSGSRPLCGAAGSPIFKVNVAVPSRLFREE
jgi:hypothetical protein